MLLLSLYIVRFLHQTTTSPVLFRFSLGCISSVSYIKPQHYVLLFVFDLVVYRPFPTSNHNPTAFDTTQWTLYIVRFLHQTTTKGINLAIIISCISSVSYIKPQLAAYRRVAKFVVYRPFPTSNHNLNDTIHNSDAVVYRPFPTSNHNLWINWIKRYLVVYRPFPTSNHNLPLPFNSLKMLYIVRFLHQTTTLPANGMIILRCISSVSYIKPQPSW